MSKRALLTGIRGQDGSYLAELLLERGYEVFGLAPDNTERDVRNIRHILDRVTLLAGNLTDQSSIDRAVAGCRPDEVYNLAALSFIKTSWEQPEATSNINGLGVFRMLDALVRLRPECRFFQASSAEMFGRPERSPQNEQTPFQPRSPYGIAKLFGHWMTVNYRQHHRLFACSGILFNHGSQRRGEQFVEQKITLAAVRIALGLQDRLVLGDTSARRDLGHAADFVEAYWLMLQQPEPDDYVIATGETHSVQEIVEFAFSYLQLDWRRHVEANHPDFMRPPEPHVSLGDASKARARLGWRPRRTFQSMLAGMIETHLATHGKSRPQAVRPASCDPIPAAPAPCKPRG